MAEEVGVAEVSIHHLLQKTVPLLFVAVVVLVVIVLLMRKEVEQAEVPEEAAQTDQVPQRALQQAVLVGMVLSKAKRENGNDHPIYVNPRWILTLRFIMARRCRHFSFI